MQRLLFGAAAADSDIALGERLDRRRLDYSLDSLHEIDRYLAAVHAQAEDIAGIPLLSTVWAVAMYVGEVIRRSAQDRGYAWVSVGETPRATGDTTIAFPDLGSVRGLRARDGEMCMPSRVILKIILRGAKARSIHSFGSAAAELRPPHRPARPGSRPR